MDDEKKPGDEAYRSPPESWVPHPVNDVAEWGDKPDPWPGGLFRSQEEFDAVDTSGLPRTPPMPGVWDPDEPRFDGSRWVAADGSETSPAEIDEDP
jgi:hypothetical protein